MFYYSVACYAIACYVVASYCPLYFLIAHCRLLRVIYNCCVFNYCIIYNNIFNKISFICKDAFLYTNYSLKDLKERYLYNSLSKSSKYCR